ncbi:hypothetical protein TELCIR_10670 [Teladorsagia circumcincta]|uniref:Uncharacterized protein n=1 Tax=Teladorsagia circumcincta TaxID=45464 RepID=A0A2G9UBI4_TELCI|nr:hypothetical protein TELCIR_10670 [Teladorsagia circumcincta]
MSVKMNFRKVVFGKKKCRSISESGIPYPVSLPLLLFSLKRVVTWKTLNAYTQSVSCMRTRICHFQFCYSMLRYHLCHFPQ